MNLNPDRVYCWNVNCLELQLSDRAICQHCSSSLLLHDRYCAIQILGQNYCGRTFLALDRGMDQGEDSPTRCVIKQSWCEPSDSFEPSEFDRTRSQFHQTIKKLRQLEHPQLPVLLDSFEQYSFFYIVQEYVAGQTLAAMLPEKGQFSATEIRQVLQSLLPVLRLIHAQGVIHADIKPANIIARSINQFTDRSHPPLPDLALVDFDISSPFTEKAIGSPEYAAPEQMKGHAVLASDLYSLGVTCIHLLTGIQPFNLFDVTDNTWAWRNYWMIDATRLKEIYEGEYLAKILDRLIDPNLDQRYASATEVLSDLEQLEGKRQTISRIAKISNWECYATLAGHQGVFGSVNAIAIASDNTTLVSASDDKTIRVWDGMTCKEKLVLRGHTHHIKAVTFHPQDATVIISGSHDRTLKIWNLQTGEAVQTLTAHQNAVNAVAFSPDGTQIASGSSDKTIKLWNFKTRELLITLTGHSLAVNAIAFAPDQSLLASGSSDKTIQIWDLVTHQSTHTISHHTWAVRAVAFSPDGTLLATGSEDRTICLWQVGSWQCLQTLSHPWAVSALTFSPDGTLLITGSWDKNVKLWRVSMGEEIAVLSGHTDSVNSVAIAPNGSFIASSSKDKTVKLWRQTE